VVVVSNSSPLIAFADIGQLNLFPAIFGSILIPPSVAAEIAPTITELPQWLSVTALKQAIPGILVQRSLGSGEREALALAIEVRAERVVLDDLPARRIARSLDMSVTGTVGVLLVAKRHGLIVSVRPHLDALVRESFFVGSGLYEEVLSLAEE
jgi:predicted nucleic acid-binding protein